MLGPEDLIQDEIEYPEQTAWLQNSFTPSQDDQRSLLRIRTRLLERHAAQVAAVSDQGKRMHSSLNDTPKQFAAGQFLAPSAARRSRKSAYRWLGAMIAVLCLAILSVSAYIVVFPMIQTGHQSTPAITPTVMPTTEPYQNPAVLEIKMTSLTIGWGRGVSVQDNVDHIVRTTDGGKTWRTFDFPDQPKGPLRYFFLDNQTAWVVPGLYGDPQAKQRLWHTTDGGQHWTPSELPPGAESFTFVDQQHGWSWTHSMRASDTLYKTADGGKTWTKLGTTSANRSITDLTPGPLPFYNGLNPIFITPQQGWATLSPLQNPTHASLYLTQDGGMTWRLQLLAQPASGPIPGIHTTLDGKGAYAVLLPPQFFTPQHALMRAISQVDSKSTRKFYIYETNNGGKTWQPLGTHIEVMSETYVIIGLVDTMHIALTNTNTVTFYALINGQWQKQYSVQIAGQVTWPPFFVDSQHGWLTASQRAGNKATLTLYATSDGGASWHEVMHVTTDVPPQGGG